MQRPRHSTRHQIGTGASEGRNLFFGHSKLLHKKNTVDEHGGVK
jgi:hypothetical protein